MQGQAQTTPPPPPPSPPATNVLYGLKFHGDGLGLAIIVLKNVLLSLVTLGIYSFWGKVNVRRYLWQSTEFYGQRLAYHGTGEELLRGFFKVAGIFALYGAARFGISHIHPLAGAGFSLITFPFFIVIIPFVMYQSYRYVYSRTSWRGIRFGMGGDPWAFVRAFAGGYFLSIITLGFYAPIWQNRLYRIRMDNSRIGTLSVRYTGKDKDAFWIFMRALPLIICTLGVYLFWYFAEQSRFRASHTWIGGKAIGAARGHLNITGPEYLGLTLMNFVCILFTAGLAIPWVIAHNMSFFLQRFSFVGNVNFNLVGQVESKGSAAADDLAGAMHVGLGF